VTTEPSIEYGCTYNLGDYENERISIRVTVGPDETPVEALARPRAFVEGTHAETVTRRKRATDIAQAQSRISDLDYWLERERKEAAEASLIVAFDPPPPVESDDELVVLQYGVALRTAEQKALRAAIDAYREEQWQKREQERQARQAQPAPVASVSADLPDMDDDDDFGEDDESFERDIERGP
jgi:hypothetical protein